MNMFRCRFCGWTQGGSTEEVNRAAQCCPLCGADNVAEGYAILIDDDDDDDMEAYHEDPGR